MNTYIEDTVTAVIAQQKRLTREKITLDSRLTDLGISSLDAITLIYEMEQEFNVEVPNELLETLDTVNDVVMGIRGLAEAKT